MSDDKDKIANGDKKTNSIGSNFSTVQFKEIQKQVDSLKYFYERIRDINARKTAYTEVSDPYLIKEYREEIEKIKEKLSAAGINVVAEEMCIFNGVSYSLDDIINDKDSQKKIKPEDVNKSPTPNSEKKPSTEPPSEQKKGPIPVFEEKPPTEPSIEPIPESIDTPVVLPEAKPAENLTPTEDTPVVLPKAKPAENLTPTEDTPVVLPKAKPAEDTLKAKPTDDNPDVVLPKAKPAEDTLKAKPTDDNPDVVLPKAKPIKDAPPKVKVKEKPKKNDPTTPKPKTAPTATPPASQSASAKPKTEKSSDSEFSSRHSEGWMPGDQYNKMPERWKNNKDNKTLLAERDKTEQSFRQEKQQDDEKTDKDQSLELGETELKRLSNAPDNDKETTRINLLEKQIDKAKTHKEIEATMSTEEYTKLTPQMQNAMLDSENSPVEENKPKSTQKRHEQEKKQKQDKEKLKNNKPTDTKPTDAKSKIADAQPTKKPESPPISSASSPSQSASAKPKTEKSGDSEFSSRHSEGWMPGDQYNKMPERWKNNPQKASLLAQRDKKEQLFRQEKQQDDEKTDKDQSLETGETELKRLSNAPDNDKESVRIEALTKQIDKAKTQKETEEYLAKEGKNLTPQQQNALLTPSPVEENKSPATQERHKKEKAEEKLKQEEKIQKANKSTPPLGKDSIPNSPLKEGIENSKSGKSKTQKAPKTAQMNSSNNNNSKVNSSTTIETGGDISTYNTEELFMKYNHENYNCC